MLRSLFLTAAGLAALMLPGACGDGDEGGTLPAAPEEADAIASVERGRAEAPATVEGPVEWAVTAAHPLATEAGAEVLRAGGSAVDAAVAVLATLGLVEPQSSGLGGGAFMLFYDASTGVVTAYDGREKAPASAREDMFLKEDGTPLGFYDAVTSGYSVGVPGAVAMLALAHEEHGRLAWAELFGPAITHAEEGFTVTPRLAGLLQRLPRLAETPEARALFFDAEGAPLEAGDLLVNEPYGETLRILAAQGPASFYTGDVATTIAAAVAAKTGPGVMTAEDLAAYEPVERRPVCAPVLVYEICSMGPPSSGGVTLIQQLKLFEAAWTPGEDWLLPYVEAGRLAYADRDRYLADPDYMRVGGADADDIVGGLLSEAYLTRRAALIGARPADTAEPGEPVMVPIKEGRADDDSYGLPSTSHFSIRDRTGNIVSMTASVEFAFGSHLMAGGMVLNNQLTDFSRIPAEDGKPVANAPAPGKRPRSSMTPVIVLEDGEPVIAIGSPGGPAIISYVAKTLVHRLFLGEELEAAALKPHVVTARGSVGAEDEATAAALRGLGYDAQARDFTSGLYGFEIIGDEVRPAVDPRREGTFVSAARTE